MRASYNWLRELSGVDAPADEIADKLTGAGLEVEGVERLGEGLEGVVVAEVRGVRPHPHRDRLRLVRVFDGAGEHEVVCGAPNVPDAGGRVLLARLGATLPGGLEIAERDLGGVVSRGMLCSEVELGIGADAAGIVVLGPHDAGAPGDAATDALRLRDVVFEIGLTPNRPDCLGHVGLARELALLYGRTLVLPAAQAPAALVEEGDALLAAGPARFALPLAAPPAGRVGPRVEAVRPAARGPAVEVEIRDAERCPRYGAALVLGVTSGPSPLWVRYRLHCLGIRAISNLVDATNLVLMERGHPIHGFDLDKVRGRKIVVRAAADGERMATLDDVERTLTADDLLICDGEGPVAVAGVMGGADSEMGEGTRDVLIECAYFDPRSVRRTSRRLGLHTEASHRFERGVDPSAVRAVLARAATLLAELGGGAVVPDGLDVVARSIEAPSVVLCHARMARLLGVEVPPAFTRRVLEGIGCEVLDDAAAAIEVRVPSHRPDLAMEADLIEEVARIYGYDRVPTAVPRVRPSKDGTPVSIRFDRRLREAAAAGAGLTEAITYAFVAPGALEAARVSTQAVPLHNPLSEERSVMRTSLLPGLLEAAAVTRRREPVSVQLFELGTVFAPGDGALPIERPMFAWLLAGPRPGWIGTDGALDFYDGKGRLEGTLRALGAFTPELRLDPAIEQLAPFLHPRRAARIALGGRDLGVLGEVHPDVCGALGLDARAVYGELDVAGLEAATRALGVAQARALPRYPAAVRDIAMVVREGHAVGEIMDALRDAGGALVERIELFDRYQGEHVPDGHVSLAFHVVYRDPQATLTDKRVDAAHAKLGATAEARFEARLRA